MGVVYLHSSFSGAPFHQRGPRKVDAVRQASSHYSPTVVSGVLTGETIRIGASHQRHPLRGPRSGPHAARQDCVPVSDVRPPPKAFLH